MLTLSEEAQQWQKKPVSDTKKDENNNKIVSSTFNSTKSSPFLSSCSPTKITGRSENIFTIPNLLTSARMVLSPFIGHLVLTHNYKPALAFLAIAGFTDMLDGYIARNFKNQSSTLGMAIDPLADKVLMTIMTVSLSLIDLFPLTLMLTIVTRDVVLISSWFALRWFSLPSPMTFKRFFDISLPSAEVYPTFFSKLNTHVQIYTIAASLAAPLFGAIDAPWLRALWVLTGVTTVVSGASYAYNGASCFKILSKKKDDLSVRTVRVAGGVAFTVGLLFLMWRSTC